MMIDANTLGQLGRMQSIFEWGAHEYTLLVRRHHNGCGWLVTMEKGCGVVDRIETQDAEEALDTARILICEVLNGAYES